MEPYELDKLSTEVLRAIKKSMPITAIDIANKIHVKNMLMIDIFIDLLNRDYIRPELASDEYEHPMGYITNSRFEITLKGIRYLELRDKTTWQYRIGTILIPIVVAFITSLFTNQIFITA